MTRRYQTYSRDPHWITVKYPGRCGSCTGAILSGQQAFYYPIGKFLLGLNCGHADDAARDFDAISFDDAQIGAA